MQCNKQNYVENFLLTVVIRVFPSRPLALSPLRHHGASLRVIVQTVPAARCFPTSEKRCVQRPELGLMKLNLRYIFGYHHILNCFET